jgi:hypothetical protein
MPLTVNEYTLKRSINSQRSIEQFPFVFVQMSVSAVVLRVVRVTWSEHETNSAYSVA